MRSSRPIRVSGLEWYSDMKQSRLLRAALTLITCSLSAVLLSGQTPSASRKAGTHHQAVQLNCDPHTGTCLLRWPDGTELGPLAASVRLVDGAVWATTDMPRHEMQRDMASPAGLATPGMRELTIRHYGRTDAPELLQHIYLPPGKPYVLMDLEAVSPEPLRSRHISPVLLATGGSARFAIHRRPTVLFVPNDNDMWVHYNEPIDPAKDPDSYEVTAIFDNASRKGMVLGSVTHDLWRTGVLARDLGDGTAGVVEVYGGATGHWTHDVEPHGIVISKPLRSPLVMVGYFSDWRNGMETFGAVNARIHPPLAWNGGVPFGWNSWSAYLEKIDKTKYLAVADFLHNELQPRGLENHGTVYVNLDGGWNAMPEADVIAAAKHIHAQGQKAGI